VFLWCLDLHYQERHANSMYWTKIHTFIMRRNIFVWKKSRLIT